jgi:hypothetical protein
VTARKPKLCLICDRHPRMRLDDFCAECELAWQTDRMDGDSPAAHALWGAARARRGARR